MSIFSARDLGPSPSPFLGLEQFINFDPYPNFKQSVELYETALFNKATCRKRQTMEKVHGLVCYEEYWHKHLLNIVDSNVKLEKPYVARGITCTRRIAQDFHQCMDATCPIHPDKTGATANIAKVTEELVDSEPQFLCSKLRDTVDIHKYPAYMSSIIDYNKHINTMRAKDVQQPRSYEWLSPKSRRQYHEENAILDKHFPPMQGLRDDIKSDLKDNDDISDLLQKYEFLFDPVYINRTRTYEKLDTNMSPSLSNVHSRLHPVHDKYTFSAGNVQPLTDESDTDESRQYCTPPPRINDPPIYYQPESPYTRHSPYVVPFFSPLQFLSMSDIRNFLNVYPEKMVGQYGMPVPSVHYEQSFGQQSFCQSTNDVLLPLGAHPSKNETKPSFTSEFKQEIDFERITNSYYVNSAAVCHMTSNYGRHRSRSRSRSPSRSYNLIDVNQHSPEMRTSDKYTDRDRDRKYRQLRVREPRVRSSEGKRRRSRCFSRSPERRKIRENIGHSNDRNLLEGEHMPEERNRRDFRRARERKKSIDNHLSDGYTNIRGSQNRRQPDSHSYSRRVGSTPRYSRQDSFTRRRENEAPRRYQYRSEQRVSKQDYITEENENKRTSRYREVGENYRSESKYRSSYRRGRKYY